MNQIPFEEFNYFCQLGIGEKLNEDFEKDNKELVESHISLLNVRQDTEDRWTLQKTRGYQQKVFSDNLRTVYSNKCCITDINTRNMIHGSHISPWRSDRGNRTNIKNGLLLSLIVHKCFDEGLISINNDYRVLVSSSISDKGLSEYLQKYENKKINLPVRKEYHPDKELLKKHRVKFNFE